MPNYYTEFLGREISLVSGESFRILRAGLYFGCLTAVGPVLNSSRNKKVDRPAQEPCVHIVACLKP